MATAAGHRALRGRGRARRESHVFKITPAALARVRAAARGPGGRRHLLHSAGHPCRRTRVLANRLHVASGYLCVLSVPRARMQWAHVLGSYGVSARRNYIAFLLLHVVPLVVCGKDLYSHPRTAPSTGGEGYEPQ
eukprot:scaffold735_cov376-Prasinococcus_capsulatus_cf.AAC.21